MDLKIDLIYKKKDVLGLDLGATSIKVAQLKRRKGKIKLAGCGARDLLSSPFEDGVIIDPKKLASEVTSLLKEVKWGKITAKRVNVSLPESKIYTRLLELPKMSEPEIKEAINWEADQYIPIPTKDLYLDWEIIDSFKKGKEYVNEIILVAVPKKIVDSYLELIRILNLEPFNVEINLQAVTRAMVSNKTKDEAIVVVDIGGFNTSVAVFDHNIRVTGSIPFGGSNIIAAAKEGKDKAVFPEATKIADEVHKLIEYYEGKKDQSQKKITKILLCGASAAHLGVEEEISLKTSLPVEVGNPWANIFTYPLKPVPKAESPRYANAIGLALKGVLDE